MAFQPLSVGDILMLSQTAWRIGRAFTHGKKSAPHEFAEVEREANGLSEALKLVAETLYADGSILSSAGDDAKSTVNTILESARITLSDLESFVERYQVIKKKSTGAGFVVERGWSEMILHNYRTVRWTIDGNGNINDLRNLLKMHSNTLNLTLQALQTRSLAKLEPMAEKIGAIHEQVNGDLGHKISDLHRIIMAIANSTPSLMPNERQIENGSVRSSVSTVEHSPNPNSHRLLESPPPRSSSHFLPTRQSLPLDDTVNRSPVIAVPRSARKDSTYFSMNPPSREQDGFADWDFESGSPPDSHFMSENAAGPGQSNSKGPNHLSPGELEVRRESTTIPNLFNHEADGSANNSDDEYKDDDSRRNSNNRISNGTLPNLPSPAIPPKKVDPTRSPATPSSIFSSPKREYSDNFHNRQSIPSSLQSFSTRSPTIKSPRQSKIDSPQMGSNGFDAPTFEKSLFRNAAILCDVRCSLVEYAQKNPDEPDPRFDTEMVPACQGARLCVIRKRKQQNSKAVASIWTLSDDGEVRLQQKLSDVLETIPYSSFFSETISIPPTEGDILLKFHTTNWGDQPREEKRTTWINYSFDSQDDAASFQSAVFGRMLLGNYRTSKTTVLHEGFKGAFALEEQFANITSLRIWQCDDVAMPGASGGVLALMHVAGNFGDGWARWWMNNSKQQVRVKEDGAKHVKIKGIDLTVVKPGQNPAVVESLKRATTGEGSLHRVDTDGTEIIKSPGKKLPFKRVTGIRVEFKTEEERAAFCAMARLVAQRPVALPDL